MQQDGDGRDFLGDGLASEEKIMASKRHDDVVLYCRKVKKVFTVYTVF